MKKPIINLAAIERIDAVPLRKALELHNKATKEIADARVREIALHKEIDDFLAKTSLDDEKGLQLVSGKKIQAEILPNLIRKLENTLENELAPSLLREAEKFQREMVRFYREAHQAVGTQLAEVFRPYFEPRTNALNGDKRDRAKEIAMQTDDCSQIEWRLSKTQGIQLPVNHVRSNAPEAFDRTLVGVAKELLEMAEKN
ncbi:MAG TPA: hypothetical protein VGM64_13295 [Lacunisphaera sp.]|jgi:hypothetical protein